MVKYDLKIYTSFVSPATLNKFMDNNLLPIFIVRNISNSDLIGEYSGTAVHFKNLAPSTELFRSRRDNIIDFEEFSKQYVIEISKINIQEVIEKLNYLAKLSNAKGIILLGYGSDNKKCHRSILSDILNNSGLLTNKIVELVL